MTDALWMIKDDHTRAAAVLYSLRGLVDNIENNTAAPNFLFFEFAINFIRDFLNDFHHPKEDEYLFSMLRRRHPEASSTIVSLEREHATGARLFSELEAALKSYARDSTSAFPRFREAVVAYVAFERKHALREEKEIFPLAEKYLTKQDLAELGEAFKDRRDPRFGAQARKEITSRISYLASTAPAPHGLGRRRRDTPPTERE